uniref:LRRNT domain-containing protein n=2 Tax=Latimeria chalumnae TaxID=7897 RepID=H3A8R2_LATCH
YEYDYGGMPVTFDPLQGEPSIFSFRARMEPATIYHVAQPGGCPLECSCVIHWPTAVYCDSRGLQDVPILLSPQTNYLYLQNNHIKSLPQGVFQNSTQIRWLILDKNELTNKQVGEGVLAGLEQLENLYLNVNNFTEVPTSLPGSLRQLRLAYNNISHIPAGAFSKLENLTLLLLHGNRIKTIGEGKLNALTSLVRLDLSHNQLTEFPQGLSPTLQQLHLFNNSLVGLPPNALAGFDGLQYLRLAHNRLTNENLPLNIFNVSSLLELDLSYNHLTSIPVVSERLQYLYLQANQIQAFNMTSFCRTVSIVDHSHLRLLRLDGNRLRYSDLPSDWVLCLRAIDHLYV